MQTAQITAAGLLEVNGLEVRYYDTGQEASSTPPVVLVHGSAGSTEEQFGFLYPMLGARRRVVSLDLQVPLGESLTVDLLERQVCAVLDHVLPGQEVALVGYSLGAVIAASVAAARPETVRQLVLVAGWMRSDAQHVLFTRVFRELYRSGSPELATYMFNHFFGGPFQAALPLEMLEPMIAMGRFDAAVERQFDLNERVDISDRLDRITARTLIIACTHDQLVPIRHGKQLFGAIEDARYTEIDCGHAVIFERPAELLRLIDHFTASPDRYPAGTIIPAAQP
ncbi:alpha/beta fold hydrolase [Arthrobacter sp. NPDC055138]